LIGLGELAKQRQVFREAGLRLRKIECGIGRIGLCVQELLAQQEGSAIGLFAFRQLPHAELQTRQPMQRGRPLS
jgi:hypothetical protein